MNLEKLLQVIISFWESEKVSNLQTKNNTYTFKVLVTATKPEIKQAIERFFNVKVVGVRVVNVKAKTKRFRSVIGKKKQWKKAYVTLSDSIDIAKMNIDLTVAK